MRLCMSCFSWEMGKTQKNYCNLLSNKISLKMNKWCVGLSLCKWNLSIFLVLEGLWFKVLLELFVFHWFSVEMMCWPPGFCPSIHSAFVFAGNPTNLVSLRESWFTNNMSGWRRNQFHDLVVIKNINVDIH